MAGIDIVGRVDHTRSLAALVEGFIGQRELRARLMPDLYAPPTYPNPGASASDLAAVEERIGRPLDPIHRQLLEVADGWKEFDGSRNLLGTADIGLSDTWRSAIEMIRIYRNEAGEAMVGWPTDIADALPLCEYSDSMAFVVMADGHNHTTGQVRDFSSGSNAVFHSVETWLRCELADETDYLDGVSYGPHGRAWRREVTAEDPAIPEIVAKLDQLRNAFRTIRPTWLPDLGPDSRSGATVESIEALRRDRQLSLSTDHQQLLLATDGWSGIGPVTTSADSGGAVDLLNVAELQEGRRWSEAVAEARDAAHRLESAIGKPVSVYPDLTPFAVSTEISSRAWVIGTDHTGQVLQWPAYLMQAQFPTVRDYLLDLVDQADSLLGMAKAAALDTEHIPR